MELPPTHYQQPKKTLGEGIFSLQQISLQRISSSLCNSFLNDIIKCGGISAAPGELRSWTSVRVRDALAGDSLDRLLLPPEVVRFLLDDLFDRSLLCFILMDLFAGVGDTWPSRTLQQLIPISCEETANLFDSVDGRIRKMDLSMMPMNDTSFAALAMSPAASQITHLTLRHAALSSATSAYWSRFTSLHYVDISKSFISENALEALCKQNTLRALHAAKMELIDYKKLIPFIIQQNLLPNLEELDLDNDEDSIEFHDKWFKLLRLRPHRAGMRIFKLGKLKLVDENSTRLLADLHCIFPSLEHPIHAHLGRFLEDLSSFVSSFKEFKIITSGEVPQEALDLLADQMPLLQSLAIRSRVSLPELGRFQFLKNLSLTTNKFQSALFSAPRPHPAKPHTRDELDWFIRGLCKSLPKLESLRIGYSDAWTYDDFMSITRNLTQLTSLRIESSFGLDKSSAKLVLSHPSLEIIEIDKLGGLPLVFGSLPKLRRVCGSLQTDNSFSAFSSLSRSSHPRLQEISIKMRPVGTGYAEYKTLAATLADLGPNLTLLELLNADNLRTVLENIDLLQFSNLSILHLCNASLGSSIAAEEMLNAMPWLTQLSLDRCTGFTSYEWLRHNNLRVLVLRKIFIRSALDIGASPLPCLESLTTTLLGAHSIECSDAPNVKFVHFFIDGNAKTAITLNETPQLMKVVLQGVCEAPISIQCAPNLAIIESKDLFFDKKNISKDLVSIHGFKTKFTPVSEMFFLEATPIQAEATEHEKSCNLM